MILRFGSLASPTTLKGIATERITYVPIDEVAVEDGFNIRDFDTPENKEQVLRLAKLIAANGILVPLHVRVADAIDGRALVLTDGETRLRGALKANEDGAGIAHVPVMLDPYGDDEVRRIEGQVIKNSGRPPAMLEMLDGVRRLKALGRTHGEIQTSFGFSRFHLANLMLLDQATAPVRTYIKAGRIAPSTVVELVREFRDQPAVVEASVQKAIEKQERIDARASSGAPAAKGRVTRGSVSEGILYTKSNFDSLISMLQRLYADLVPAGEQRKRRTWIKNCLESIGADPAGFDPDEAT